MCPDQHEAMEAAYRTYVDAEAAYRAESARYVSIGWVNEPLELPEKAISDPSFEEFRALRTAAQKAEATFWAEAEKRRR